MMSDELLGKNATASHKSKISPTASEKLTKKNPTASEKFVTAADRLISQLS